MESRKDVQHVYLVGAKSLGAYGGYETFVYKLTEHHQNKKNIKYHVACKANGDGCILLDIRGQQYWMSQYGRKIHFQKSRCPKKAKSLKIYYCRI